MSDLISIVIAVVIGYLLGSIPFALVIGKVFYHTDVREHGSGNLGGTNTGRVLGAKAGIAVIVLDILKVVLAVWIASYFSKLAAISCGFACCIGHIYPIFAGFKGGKAVATMFGFLLSLSIFIFGNPAYFLGPLVMFFILLYLYRWVSLSSISAAVCSAIQITSMNFGTSVFDLVLVIGSWLLAFVIIYRHMSNVHNIRDNKEKKITWLK